jgi:phosphatidylserine/phosphatidylglycerophosphate/cardiolipin synthase-like enzyme
VNKANFEVVLTTQIITTPNHPIEKIKDLLANTQYVCMVSPYIKESFIRRIIEPISRIKDIRLIARLTNYEISTNSVDLSALDLIAQYGEVRCLNTLHAKGILTERQAYIGSLNFTHSAFFRNYEMGIISDESTVHRCWSRFAAREATW